MGDLINSRMGQVCSYVIGIANRVVPSEELTHRLTEAGWLRFAEIEDMFRHGDVTLPSIGEVLAILAEIMDEDTVEKYMITILEEIYERLLSIK